MPVSLGSDKPANRKDTSREAGSRTGALCGAHVPLQDLCPLSSPWWGPRLASPTCPRGFCPPSVVKDTPLPAPRTGGGRGEGGDGLAVPRPSSAPGSGRQWCPPALLCSRQRRAVGGSCCWGGASREGPVRAGESAGAQAGCPVGSPVSHLAGGRRCVRPQGVEPPRGLGVLPASLNPSHFLPGPVTEWVPTWHSGFRKRTPGSRPPSSSSLVWLLSLGQP